MASLAEFGMEEFDASTVPDMGFNPVPPGVYTAMITSTELKENNNRTGSYVLLVQEVLDEEFRGRKVWVRLNVVNPSPDAVSIARRELAAVARAVGNHNLRDTNELCNKPFLVELAIELDNRNREQNVTKGYAPVGTNKTGPGVKLAKEAAASSAPAAATSKQAQANAAPWKK